MEEWSTFRLTGDGLAGLRRRRSECRCPWLTAGTHSARGPRSMPSAHRHTFRGMRTAEHYFQVPLDHFGADPARRRPSRFRPRIRLRRSTATTHAAGCHGCCTCRAGPAGAATASPSLGGWSKAAAKDFRILMLDQRGTGLSSPVDRNTLPLRGDAPEQADYLTHFRADSIVADAEPIRRALGAGRGPSTARATAVSAPSATFRSPPRGCARSSSPAAWPRWRVRRTGSTGRPSSGSRPATPNTSAGIPRTGPPSPGSPGTCGNAEEYLPDGGRLTVERFQMVGLLPGRNTRVDALHHLLEDAFVATPAGTGSRTPSWSRSRTRRPGPPTPCTR